MPPHDWITEVSRGHGLQTRMW